ncbi:uncharacterized protein [Triticum aestivum]|uniref:uncharacterized protein n=1 Tax=Triticum aestivum TaxID=4565 RepID=UPI001D00A43B|nr:uncharacterized protein LOC123125635 [Triticum aestivum]
MQICAVGGGRWHGNSTSAPMKREDHGAHEEENLSMDIYEECATQLQNELHEEYVKEEVSNALIRDITVRASQRIAYVIDSDSSEDLVHEIWSDPEHEELVEIDRRLREEEQQKESIEQQQKDAELAKLCQLEEERVTVEQVHRDNGLAHMYQALYNHNATDEQVREATALSAGEAQVHATGGGAATLIERTTGSMV